MQNHTFGPSFSRRITFFQEIIKIFENGKFHRSKHFENEFEHFLAQKMNKFQELTQKG